jgi:1-phosphofructokinase
MPHDRANVCVFASTLLVTVTVEKHERGRGDDIHFHPGGQGFWIARMLRHLGERPVLCGPVGGESGRVLRGLVPQWGIDLSPVDVSDDAPAYLHDRRSGKRVELAHGPSPELDRHEIDDLYGRTLEHATATGFCVVTGRVDADGLPLDFYRRLGADLAATRTRVVGDLHQDELEALLSGGPIEILKVSDEELRLDGRLAGEGEAGVLAAIRRLEAEGAQGVVVSRGDGATLARLGGVDWRARPPRLAEVDARGSGDSMTAALAVGLLRSLSAEQMLRLGCAAGAANVTRHGLGNADRDLIEKLSAKVEIERLAPP